MMGGTVFVDVFVAVTPGTDHGHSVGLARADREAASRCIY
jgi:hypothetical protein